MATSRRHVSLEWKSLDKFGQSLRKLNGNWLRAGSGALYREAQSIITTSKAAFVPVDSGNLRASGFVKEPEIAGMTIVVIMGFGGPAGRGNQGQTNNKDAGYALPVHEVLGLYHPIGQAKYLEVPIRAAITGMDDRLAADIRRSN